MNINIRKTSRTYSGGSRVHYELFDNDMELCLAFDSEADAAEGVRIAKNALKIAGKKAIVSLIVAANDHECRVQVNGKDVYKGRETACRGMRNVVHDILHIAGVELP